MTKTRADQPSTRNWAWPSTKRTERKMPADGRPDATTTSMRERSSATTRVARTAGRDDAAYARAQKLDGQDRHDGLGRRDQAGAAPAEVAHQERENDTGQ